MKVKKEMLQAYMKKRGISAAELAKEMCVAQTEIELLLNGAAVKEPTARQFINYFGVDEAAKYIDWAAIGKKNPFEK